MYATPPATSTMLPLRCVAHRYASFIHIFRSSPLLFPTDGLKNSDNKYHVHPKDGHGIFSFHLFTFIIHFLQTPLSYPHTSLYLLLSQHAKRDCSDALHLNSLLLYVSIERLVLARLYLIGRPLPS